MSTALNPLVEKIRTAHPGAYDDMDDAALTKAVLAKYPQYSDLAAPPASQAPGAPPSRGGAPMQTSPMSFLQQRGAQTAENAVNAAQHIAPMAKQIANDTYDVSAPNIATEVAKHMAGRPNDLKNLPPKMVMAWLTAGGLPEAEGAEAAEAAPVKAAATEATAPQATRTIVRDSATGRPEFSDVLAAKASPAPVSGKTAWPPPEPTGAYDKVPKAPGGLADLQDDQAAREEVQARIEQSDRKWMKDASRQYRDRNDVSTPKSVLTGAADKPVTLTKTPGVKPTAPAAKLAATPEEDDLIQLLQKSLDQALAAKKAR